MNNAIQYLMQSFNIKYYLDIFTKNILLSLVIIIDIFWYPNTSHAVLTAN